MTREGRLVKCSVNHLKSFYTNHRCEFGIDLIKDKELTGHSLLMKSSRDLSCVGNNLFGGIRMSVIWTLSLITKKLFLSKYALFHKELSILLIRLKV